MTPNLPSHVFCTPDMKASTTRRYPAEYNIPVDLLEVPVTQFTLLPAMPNKFPPLDTTPPTKKPKHAVGLSAAAIAFAAEFKLPGQSDNQAAKPNAKPTPSTDKKPPRAGMKPATVAFINEFSLLQSK